jgi:putative FmdB family regulatory protein
MPIYEYDCQSCGDRFEKLVFTQGRDVQVQCPQCGSAHVSKRLSLIAGTSGGSRETGASPAACTTST